MHAHDLQRITPWAPPLVLHPAWFNKCVIMRKSEQHICSCSGVPGRLISFLRAGKEASATKGPSHTHVSIYVCIFLFDPRMVAMSDVGPASSPQSIVLFIVIIDELLRILNFAHY